MFLRNIANFLSSPPLDTKWSTLHHKANIENGDTSESFMLENWKQIKNPTEFKSFIDQHKAQNYAFLLSDYRHRPVLIHHVSHHSDNIFLGINGNSIDSIPSELDIRSAQFTIKKAPAGFHWNTSTTGDSNSTYNMDSEGTVDYSLPRISSILPVHPEIWIDIIKLKQPFTFQALKEHFDHFIKDKNNEKKLPPHIKENINLLGMYKILDFTQMCELKHLTTAKIYLMPDLEEASAYIKDNLPPATVDLIVTHTNNSSITNHLNPTNLFDTTNVNQVTQSDVATTNIPPTVDIFASHEQNSIVLPPEPVTTPMMPFTSPPRAVFNTSRIPGTPHGYRPTIPVDQTTTTNVITHSNTLLGTILPVTLPPVDITTNTNVITHSNTLPGTTPITTLLPVDQTIIPNNNNINSTRTREPPLLSLPPVRTPRCYPPTTTLLTVNPTSTTPNTSNTNGNKSKVVPNLHNTTTLPLPIEIPTIGTPSPNTLTFQNQHHHSFTPANPGFNSNAPASEQLNDAMQTFLQIVKLQTSAISDQNSTLNLTSNSKKSKLDSLTDSTLLVIKRGSAFSIHDGEPTEFCQSFHELYSSANKSKFISFMDEALRKDNVRGSFQHGHITYLLQIGPLWHSPTNPTGLTVFAIHPRSALSTQSSRLRRQEIQTSLKVYHSNHLDNEDLEYLVAQGFFFPTNIHDFELMLSTFVSVLGIYFGKLSIIYKAAQSCLSHFFEYQEYYEDQASNPLWCSKVLYAIDNSIQTHLQGLRDDAKPFPELNFHFVFEKIILIQNQILGRDLNISLPQSLLQLRTDQLKEKPKEERPAAKKLKYSKDQKQENVDADPAINPRPNPKWTLPAGKTFKDCFHQNKQQATSPKHGNIYFCLQYFTCNRCKRGLKCPYEHTDPRDVNKAAEFDKYCFEAFRS